MRTWRSFALRAAVTVALMALLLSQADLSTIGRQLASVDPRFFAGAALAQGFVMLLSAWRWRLLLERQGHAIPLLELTKITWIASFFGTFLPATAGNDLVRGQLLHRRGVPLADLVSSILVDRVIGTLALIFLTIPPLVILLQSQPGLEGVAWAVALLMVATFLAAFAGPKILRRARGWRLPGFLRKGLYGLDAVAAGCARLLRGRKTMAATIGLSLAVHALTIVLVYLVGRAVGVELGILYYALFVPLIWLLSLLPVSISGLGLRDAGFVALFGQVGVPTERALTMSLLVFAIILLSSAVGGVLYLTRGFGLARNAAPARAPLPTPLSPASAPPLNKGEGRDP